MDDNEKLNLLFDMTEEQQAAIGEAIVEFKRQNERLETSGGNLQKVVKTAIVESMSGTAGTAKKAVDDALAPALQSINGTINAAGRANEKLNNAVERLGWQMALMAGGFVVAVIVSANVMVWWERSELATIKENIASQNALKGQIKIATCGGYPCVEIDSVAPATWGEYRILKGVKFK